MEFYESGGYRVWRTWRRTSLCVYPGALFVRRADEKLVSRADHHTLDSDLCDMGRHRRLARADGRENYSLDILSVREKMQPWQWIAALTLVIVSVIIQYFDWGGFKIVIEFQHLGAVMFVFQYLYYVFETLLFMMIIVFGQRACELWLGHGKIPYGGILCGLTWGLGHILSKGSLLVGIHGLLWGILLGTAYLVVNREIRKAWVLLFLMFVI